MGELGRYFEIVQPHNYSLQALIVTKILIIKSIKKINYKDALKFDSLTSLFIELKESDVTIKIQLKLRGY